MSRSHRTAWANIARVVTTQGIKGEVVVVPTDGLPFLMEEGLAVILTPPPAKGVRSAEVLRIRDLKRGYGVLFSGVDGIDQARELVGKLVLARRADLAADPEDVTPLDAVGLRVCDEALGELGVITEVGENAAYEIWTVEGPYGEVMIPVVEEFVCALPSEEGEPVVVRLPKGLVGLNGEGDEETPR